MVNIGDKIKKIRLMTGLNQKQFSSKLGISQGRLSEIEKGKNYPSFETLVSLKDNFNISLDLLLDPNYPISDISNLISPSSIEHTSLNLTSEELYILKLLRQLSYIDRIKMEGRIEDIIKGYSLNNTSTLKKAKSSSSLSNNSHDEEAAALDLA